ncbi:MAG: hypothetical protein NTV34_18150 [Proteobacteria bacterium]|nr:hypothetical protein [Pseudomonadota bacterium]
MILKKSDHTKIVWSFSSQVLDDDLAKRIANEHVSAVRLVFHGDAEDRIPKFIDDFHKAYTGESGPQAAVMVDLSEGARAQITGIFEASDVQHGDKLTFTHNKVLGPEKLEFAVQARKWDGLFRQGAMVYIGYGLVVLKALEVKSSSVTLEVVQGGQIFPDSEIHIPETRVKRTLASFDKGLLQKLVDRKVEYLVLPGILDANEIKSFRAAL